MDLVYVVGGPAENDREDLRYSLRSFAKNYQGPAFRDVWVVGDVPDWFTGARLPLPPHPEKFQNQRASLTAYVECAGAAASFVLANDDMFLIEPIDGPLPIVRASAETGIQYATVHRNFSRYGRCVPSCYQCQVSETAVWTVDRLGHDAPIYEAHSPLLFDTGRLREVLAEYPEGRPFAVGEVYPIAGLGGEGVVAGNAKVRRNDAATLAKKLGNPMPYLSCSPESWAGVVGSYVKPLFTEPSPWEA